MKRKYLSALLMGALTVTSVSTFTSCKDYDSDISNLQGQIDKAALKTEVEAMKTTVEAAKTAAESAKTTAEKNATDLTDVKAKAEKLATQVAEALQTGKDAKAAADEAKDQCDELELKFFEYYTAEEVDKALDKLEAKIDANTESIEDLKAEVESYSSNINKLYSAVTGVYLVDNGDFSSDLEFTLGKVGDKDYTFGAGEYDKAGNTGNKYTATPTKDYKAGSTISFPQELLVRVNPVNAVVTKDMIKLVDSECNDLIGDLLEIDTIAPYTALLTKASTQNGLWKVSLKLKDGKSKESLAACKANDKDILYGVAVNNTAAQKAENAASRYVVSDYAVTVKPSDDDYVPATSLQNVQIKADSEKEWKYAKALKYYNGSSSINSDLVYAQNGENINIKFENIYDDNDMVAINDLTVQNIDRYYVVLDKGYAETSSSHESEYNAWKSYSYTGLETVIPVQNGTNIGKFSVTIPSTAKEGDEVQFRIFAVNYDGSIVEDGGRAFRVYVGPKTTNVSAQANAVATGKEAFSTGIIKLTGSLVDDAAGNKLQAKGTVTLKTTSGSDISATYQLYTSEDENATSADKLSDYKYIKLTVNSSLTNWPDETVATGTISDTNKPSLNSISVSITKSMPTVETAKKLAAYAWKKNQKDEETNTYTAYLYPYVNDSGKWAITGSDVVTGHVGMNQVINYLDKLADGQTDSPLKNTLTFDIEKATKDDDDKYTKVLTVNSSLNGTWDVNADVALVDNKTTHTTTVYYNFGKISSNTNSQYADAQGNVKIAVETYNTIFACPLDETVQDFEFIQGITTKGKTAADDVYGDVNYLYYNDANQVAAYKSHDVDYTSNITRFIKAKNAFDNTTFGKDLSDLLKDYKKYTGISAALYTKGTTRQDYFTVTVNATNGTLSFVPNSQTQAPTQDVESTLHIELKDAFGHTHKYDLPFTVKRAK